MSDKDKGKCVVPEEELQKVSGGIIQITTLSPNSNENPSGDENIDPVQDTIVQIPT